MTGSTAISFQIIKDHSQKLTSIDAYFRMGLAVITFTFFPNQKIATGVSKTN